MSKPIEQDQDQDRLRRCLADKEEDGRVDGGGLALPERTVLVGDALEQLQQLPEASIDTVVTSPPYWMLRNYGVKDEIGSEASVPEWVGRLRAVLAEVARVLKPEGALWLNIGDTYSRHAKHGALPKSLVLGPERLLLALIEDQWVVRNKLVFAKSNPMPSSVRDRLSSTWEPLYLLVRSQFYFFDLDAIRVPARSGLNAPTKVGTNTKYAWDARQHGHRPSWSGPMAGTNSGLPAMKARGENSHLLGKNPGDVWTIPTASYRGAHFATFPEALVERPLLATCPERVCRTCGRAWRRSAIVQRLGALAMRGALRKSCPCPGRAWQPGVVIDPFMGAGTVGVVAERLHRRWLGIELNPDFARLAEERIAAARRERFETGGPPVQQADAGDQEDKTAAA